MLGRKRGLRQPAIQLLAEDNARNAAFTPAEVQALLAHLHEDLRPVLQLATITGWRIPSELLTRRWKDVDFTEGWLYLHWGEAKDKRSWRRFPLIPELRAILEQQRARTTELERETGKIIPWVFWRRRGPGVVEDGVPVARWDKAWATACRKAGVHGKVRHCFRATAARMMDAAGLKESDIMAFAGWRTHVMLRRYIGTSEEKLRLAGDKLSAHLQAAGDQPGGQAVLPFPKSKTGSK